MLCNEQVNYKTTELWKLLLDHVLGLLKYSWMDPIARVFGSVVLGWEPRICNFNKFPSDADAAGLGTTLREPLSQISEFWSYEIPTMPTKCPMLKSQLIGLLNENLGQFICHIKI